MEFNVCATTNRIIEDIKEYYQKNNATGAVIGLSGGKDSAVVASLLVKALGSDNVVTFFLPCHSNAKDRKDAYEVAKALNIKIFEHDLTKTYENIINDAKNNFNVSDSLLINANINIKPRLRMSMLYYYASVLSSKTNGLYLVAGTSNKSEVYVGYFTKGGDNICDIAPIKELYVDEVIKVGDYLNMVPKEIIYKTPDDGLSGMTDEEKLGFKYSDVKKVCLEEEYGITDNSINLQTKEKILKMHKNNLHKFNIPKFGR